MNTNRSLNRRVEVAIAAVLLASGSTALAGPTSEWRYIGDFQAALPASGLATGPFQSTAGLGSNFDSSSWNGGSASAKAASVSTLTLDAQTAAATDASTASADTRRHALASSLATSNTAPVIGSPAALDLTLWNFIANIRAQQAGNPFIQLRTNAANIDYTLNDVPAPVPLPPTFWLFAGGLGALSLARLFARRKGAGEDARGLAPA